nr:MAG TPA: Membrane MotB of proton-channel complex MotA/MotB [Caudoviricetes sp.]
MEAETMTLKLTIAICIPFSNVMTCALLLFVLL